MAFESLTGRLQSIFKKISGQSRLTEKNIDEMLVEVRKALLEADVNFKVVKDFIMKVRVKAVGEKVLTSLNPSQMVVKIVDEELRTLLGGKTSDLHFNPNGMTVILLCGLQGSGKTTHAAKLASLLIKKYHKSPFLIGADIYRPAAFEQLKILGESIGVDAFTIVGKSATVIVEEGLKKAKELGKDVVIIDTAGRLHIDEQLMKELQEVAKLAKPHETLLVIDALSGQDAANVAAAFHRELPLTGVILSKLDSDTRGGAALSVVSITSLPIKFSGVGEKINDLETFHPDRMANRILGMGDILTLIEKAQQEIDEKEARKMSNRMMSGKFDLNDMLNQLEQVKKIGSLGGIMKFIPGVPKISKEQLDTIETQLAKYKVIIQSMTSEERATPEVLKASRKIRVAKGCGRSVTEVNTMLSQFEKMKVQMKQLGGMMQSGKMPF